MASYQYIYTMQGLSKTYPGGKTVLKDIHLSFLPGAKIGVLGLNGAGKSTLLKIMAGQEKEFNGEAWAAEGAKVGYLPQEPELDPDKDVAGNVMQGLGDLKALVDRFEEVNAAFAEEDADFEEFRLRALAFSIVHDRERWEQGQMPEDEPDEELLQETLLYNVVASAADNSCDMHGIRIQELCDTARALIEARQPGMPLPGQFQAQVTRVVENALLPV